MAKKTDAQAVKPEAQAAQAAQVPAPRKAPAREAFYRVRRLDTWNYQLEVCRFDPGSLPVVTKVGKPDLKRIVMGKLEEILLG